jgi:hypothetical protein
MGRCGCTEACACLITPGLGIDVDGTGDANNPYKISFDPTNGGVIGRGLTWSGQTLSTNLKPGGGLEFDPVTGAMLVTGGGDPGGGGIGATVKSLETLTVDVIGGSLGAGFMHKPPDLLSSYIYGQTVGLDFLQVPVRFLSDGTPVVSFYETLTNVEGLNDIASRPIADQHVQDQDLSRWRTGNLKPGAFMLPQKPTNVTDPIAGWFGYLEPGQYGLTTLADVLRAVGNKVVLLLNLTFPAVNGSGAFVHATPAWRTELFIRRTIDTITSFGATGSVIVTTDQLFIPPNSGTAPTDVLKRFSDNAMVVGPYMANQAMIDAYPPDDPTKWQPTWTWVFASWRAPRANLAKYVAAKLHTILFVVSRHYLRSAIVHNSAQVPGANGVGAKGVISADPEYYGGIASRGALVGWKYRKYHGDWQYGTVHHGLLPPGDDTLPNVKPSIRGWSYSTYDACWMGSQSIIESGSNTAWVLHGELSPFPDTNSFSLDFGPGFGMTSPEPYGWMALAFAVPTDHGFKDPPGAVAPGDPLYALDSGYVMLFDTNGFAFLWAFDKGVQTTIGGGKNVIGGDPAAGAVYWYRIGVNPNGIKVTQLTGNGQLGTVLWEVKTDLAKQFRGQYCYLGRLGKNITAWNGYTEPISHLPGGGFPPNGPVA